MAVERDWPPVRRGAVCCSPCCGFNCTWAKFQEATRKAKALAKRMGQGWEPDVWENMGWHYKVSKGLLFIHPGAKGYTAYLNTFPQFIVSHKSPRVAADMSIKELDEYIRYLQIQQRIVAPVLRYSPVRKKAA